MLDQFIGIVKIFAGNFAPEGWAFCNGQLLPINDNEALFSIIGTTYGGDGMTNFALPNLNGRVPIGTGQSTVLGQASGSENVTILANQLPSHSHVSNAISGGRETDQPAGNYLVPTPGGLFFTKKDSTDTLMPMNAQVISPFNGGGQTHNNMSPYLALNYVIAIYGIYPTRD